VLTVPYDHSWDETLVRVRVEGDKDVHILPDEYHGGGGQTLSYRAYGRDLLSRLRAHGFSVGYLDLERPDLGIVRQPVFLAVKNAYIDLTKLIGTRASSRAPEVNVSPLVPFRIFLTLKYNIGSLGHFVSEIVRRSTDAFRGSRKS